MIFFCRGVGVGDVSICSCSLRVQRLPTAEERSRYRSPTKYAHEGVSGKENCHLTIKNERQRKEAQKVILGLYLMSCGSYVGVLNNSEKVF